MNPNQRKLLKSLSVQIRQQLVDFYDYEFFDHQFCGACAVAAWTLREAAKAHKIKLNLVVCNTSMGGHVWCELEDETIVDPTFAQFRPKVKTWIGPRTKYHKLVCDCGEKECDYCDFEFGVNGNAKHVLDSWPVEQNPFSIYHRGILNEILGNISQ